jgi:hypothetical protein
MLSDQATTGVPLELVNEAIKAGNALADVAAGLLNLDAAAIELALARWEAALFAIARAA